MMYSITSFANNDSFTSFKIWISFFFSLVTVARIFKTMLNNSGEWGHRCLILDSRGNAFSFSPLKMMVVVGLLYMTIIMLRFVPAVTTFWRIFIINSVEFCQKYFLHLLRWSYIYICMNLDIVALQCYVCFHWAMKWISYMCTCILSLLDLPSRPPSHLAYTLRKS